MYTQRSVHRRYTYLNIQMKLRTGWVGGLTLTCIESQIEVTWKTEAFVMLPGNAVLLYSNLIWSLIFDSNRRDICAAIKTVSNRGARRKSMPATRGDPIRKPGTQPSTVCVVLSLSSYMLADACLAPSTPAFFKLTIARDSLRLNCKIVPLQNIDPGPSDDWAILAPPTDSLL